LMMLVGSDVFINIPKGVRNIVDSPIIVEVPRQLCYVCNTLFRAYLIDDDKWRKMPKRLRCKFVCAKCYRKIVHGRNKREMVNLNTGERECPICQGTGLSGGQAGRCPNCGGAGRVGRKKMAGA